MDVDNKANIKKMIIAVAALFIVLLVVLFAVNQLSGTGTGKTSVTPRDSFSRTASSAVETTGVNSTVSLTDTPTNTPTVTPSQTVKTTFETLSEVKNGETLQVHFINVGEADSILITSGGYNMLIDAGESSAGKAVVQYLQSLNIDTIHYLIATHPDQDHIGGMDSVISRFKVENFYINGFYKESKHYNNLMEAVNEKKLEITNPEPGVKNYEFDLGQAKCRIIAPLNEYSKSGSNNSSIVIRMTFGEKIFLFMGDAEKDAEADILNKYDDLKADVLKVAYHGRSDSTTKDFVKAVNPQYAVIPCEEETITGSVVRRLEDYGALVYVLGRDGNVVCTTDGRNINFEIK